MISIGWGFVFHASFLALQTRARREEKVSQADIGVQKLWMETDAAAKKQAKDEMMTSIIGYLLTFQVC